MVSPRDLPRPTPMSNRVVYNIFWFLIFKTYTHYVFKMYMYYKRNTGGLYFILTRRCQGRFSSQPVTFKRNWSNDWFFVYVMYILFYYWYLFYKLFSTSRHSKLVGYAFILFIHWVRGLLTLSLSLFFKLSTDPTLSWRGGDLVAPLSKLSSI